MSYSVPVLLGLCYDCEMSETIKSLQWNIGGGMIPRPDTDKTLISSYTVDGFDHIASVLLEERPDVVTLQETHEEIVPKLAVALGYKHWFNDICSDSHITKGQNLGLAVLSRFAILNHSYEQFFNPKLSMVWEDGSEVISADKGISSCNIQPADNLHMTVQTLHVLPFRRFSILPLSQEGEPVLADVAAKLAVDGICLIQGDFNINDESLRQYFPGSFGGYERGAYYRANNHKR